MLLPVEDDDDYDLWITAREAAAEFGVSHSTIHSWVRKGYLTAIGHDVRYGRRVPVYIRGDVATAEKMVRDRFMHRRGILA